MSICCLSPVLPWDRLVHTVHIAVIKCLVKFIRDLDLSWNLQKCMYFKHINWRPALPMAEQHLVKQSHNASQLHGVSYWAPWGSGSSTHFIWLADTFTQLNCSGYFLLWCIHIFQVMRLFAAKKWNWTNHVYQEARECFCQEVCAAILQSDHHIAMSHSEIEWALRTIW